jgi:EAL domain-containing protein (putative c-di-GMP-specific phosphodiesterase class I)
VTVNVSVSQVLSGHLLEDVEAALQESGLAPNRLQLEITESMFVSDHVRVTPVFEALRARGMRILLDDFGTGYSSLAYLGKLPIDVIKIDQSFVKAAEHDGFAVINAILSIARALRLEVTAEGVETVMQRTVLASIGVERLQGYLISRPLQAGHVVRWLAAHEAMAA